MTKNILAHLNKLVASSLSLALIAGPVFGQAPPQQADGPLARLLAQDASPSLPGTWSAQAMSEWSAFLVQLDGSNVSREKSDEIRTAAIRSLAGESSWLDEGELRQQGLELCVALTTKRDASLRSPLHPVFAMRYSSESWIKGLKLSEHILARNFLEINDRYRARRTADISWASHSEHWESNGISDLNIMIRQSWQLSLDGESPERSVAKKLFEHVWSEFLTNETYLQSEGFNIEKMTMVANALAMMYPREQRPEIGLRLAAAWGAQQEWFTSLSPEQVLYLQSGVQAFFIRSEVDCPQLAVEWVNAGEHWHDIDAVDTYLLLHQLIDRRVVSTSDEYQKVRTKAAQTVVSRLMKRRLSEQADWSVITFDEMMTYISKVGGLVEKQDAISLQNRILRFYINDKTRLRSIDASSRVGDFAPLADLVPGGVTAESLYAKRHLEGGEWKKLAFKPAFRLLDFSADDSKEADRFRMELLAYLTSHPELEEVTPERAVFYLTSLRRFSESKFSKDSELLRQTMADSVIRSTIANASDFQPSDIQKLEVLIADASEQEKQKVAAWALEFARNRVDWLLHYGDQGVEMAISIDRFIQSSIKEPKRHDTLINEMYVDAILFDSQTLPPQLTLNNGTSFHHGYPRLWYPKGSTQRNLLKRMRPEAIAMLRKQLLQEKWPAPFAVTMLVHAARSGEEGELHSLSTYFSEKASKGTGDVKARWLMARAYAAEAETSPTWSVLHGQKYLEEALAVAETDQVKQDIVRWLVQGQAALGYPDRARALMDKHQSIFERDSEDELFRQIAAAEEGRRKWVQRQVDYETDQRRQVLQQRLEKARTTGNQAQIDRYGRMLEQFDQQ